jgi:hypothetical protein
MQAYGPDIDWSHGHGPEVTGPAEAMVMMISRAKEGPLWSGDPIRTPCLLGAEDLRVMKCAQTESGQEKGESL